MAEVIEKKHQMDLGGRESIYQPEDQSQIFPYQPKFDNFAQERQYLKERLVAACRAFALEKFCGSFDDSRSRASKYVLDKSHGGTF